jgi:hypothetical protein
MKWFDRWLTKKIKQAWENARNEPEEQPLKESGIRIRTNWNSALTSPKQTASSRHLESRGMNFTMYNAMGGWVLEYNFYDEKNDQHHKNLHIITDEQDLGQRIAHIISYEQIKL